VLWESAGSKDLYIRANQKAREILQEHEAPPIPEETEDLIQEILAGRKKRNKSAN